jgi:hypothetical protein
VNQDQVKEALLSVEDAPIEFAVIFSGKKSRKVNGLYKPDSREILLHNRNFDVDGKQDTNLLLYTAIHEYAHHLHACSRGGKLSARAHTAEFWAIFHGLLERAEAKGVYRNEAAHSPELAALTETIRGKYLARNGELFKELGGLLLKAHDLCEAAGARYEDYVDRVLCIPRQAAAVAVKMYQYDLDPAVGPDNMRYLAGLRNGEDRSAAEAALLTGKSPDSVKVALRGGAPALSATPLSDEDRRGKLEKERQRLQRTIAALTRRLGEVEEELGEV